MRLREYVILRLKLGEQAREHRQISMFQLYENNNPEDGNAEAKLLYKKWTDQHVQLYMWSTKSEAAGSSIRGLIVQVQFFVVETSGHIMTLGYHFKKKAKMAS